MVNITIGQKIKKTRTDAGITGEELAKKLGISSGMVYRIETDSKQPSLKLLATMAKTLGTDISELVKGVKI